MRSRTRILTQIAEEVANRPARVILLGFVTTAACLLASSRHLDIDTDYNNLLPEGSASVTEMKRVLEEHGAVSHLMFVVEGRTHEDRAAFADTLANRLALRSDLFRSATSRMPVEWFRRRALLYLDDEGATRFSDDLRNHHGAYGQILHADGAADFFDGACDLLESRWIEGDGEMAPEDDERAASTLEELTALARIGALGRGDGDDRAAVENHLDGMLLAGDSRSWGGLGSGRERVTSTDGEAILVVAHAARSTLSEEGRAFIGETMDGARAAIHVAENRVPGVTARISGPLAQQEAEEAIIRTDLKRTGRAAAIGIALLLGVVLRLWIAPVLALVPLVMAVGWSLGIVTWTIGRLNVFSVMFVAIVLGLGIDFGIHLLVRYGEELGKGATLTGAIRKAIGATGDAVTTGAITTVMAFGALVASDYVAFRELGLVAGLGIGLSFVAFLTVMPALLLVKDRWNEKHLASSRFRTRPPALRDHLGPLGRHIETHPGAWAVIVGSLTVGSLLLSLGVGDTPGSWWARGVQFDGNMQVAQPDTPTHRVQAEITDRFGMGGESFYLSTADLAECRDATQRLVSLVNDEGNPLVARIVSAADFVPSNQVERIDRDREVRAQLETLSATPPLTPQDPPSIAGSLERLRLDILEIGDLGYLSGLESLPSITDSLARELETILASRKSSGAPNQAAVDRTFTEALDARRAALTAPEQAHPFGVSDLPAVVRSQVAGKTGGLLVSAYGSHETYDDEQNQAVTARMRDEFPSITGIPVLYADLLALSRSEAVSAVRLACLLVVLALLWDLRSVRHTIATLVPVTVGFTWTFGAMRLLGIDFDFANVIAAPLVLGIGIDDGIHMMHRYREEGRGSVARVMTLTGRAVFLTSLTTAVGFGVFGLAHHDGLRSLGGLVVLGVAGCFFATIIAWPLAITLSERREQT